MTAVEKNYLDDLWDQLMQLATDLATPIRLAFLAAVNHVTGQYKRQQLLDALAQQDITTAMRLLTNDGKTFQAMDGPLHDALVSVGRYEVDRIVTPMKVAMGFDAYNPATVNAAQQYGATLVRELTQAQRDAVSQTLAAGLRDHIPPRELARRLTSSIGLTARQQQAVLNYRNALQMRDRNALQRTLRDARSDRKVTRLFASGQGLSVADINRLTDAYAKRMLRYRAETIARTESIRALRIGTQAAWQQLIDKGVWSGAELRQKWFVALDERACPICKGIRRENPSGVPIGAAFQLPFGGVIIGPPAHPSCRCVVAVTVRGF